MSEYSESARKAMKEKAGRLSKGDPQAKVDASSWNPPELEGSQKQTGERVLSKRAYKAGGRVAHILGEKSKGRADRSARASGGKLSSYIGAAKKSVKDLKSVRKDALDARDGSKEKFNNFLKADDKLRNRQQSIVTAKSKIGHSDTNFGGKDWAKGNPAKVKARKDGGKAMTADSWTNRDVKEANQERNGFKHVGGFKKGGAIRKANGGLSDLKGELKQSQADRDDYDSKVGNFNQKYGASMPKAIQPKKAGGTVDGHPKNCTCKKCCNGGAMKASGGSASKDPFAEDDDYVTKGKKMGGAAVASGGRKAKNWGGAMMGGPPMAMGRPMPPGGGFGGPAAVNPGVGAAGGPRPMGQLYKKGGRIERKSGGRTKGKTNINIIIGAGGKGNDQGNQMPNMPMRAPVPPPIVPPVAGPPPMAGGMPPVGAGAPPMMRKDGGRAHATHVIDNAAGGGKGRLQKIGAYGLKH